jgi:aldehyde dehydrogenase (NAD+)
MNVQVSSWIGARPKQLLIDGVGCEAEAGERFESRDPSTGELVAELARARPADVDRAVAAARRAFEGPWSRFTPAERQRVLLKLADLVEAEFDDLARLDTLEMGRPITGSLAMKSMVVRLIRYFAGAATAIHGHTLPNSFPVPMQSFTLREPIGVVGAINPWNGPIFSAAWKTTPALAVGCTVVLKPAEDASLTHLRFAELCLEAGIPPGVVNVVTGPGDVGAALVEHRDVDKITFTGSTPTGQRIIAASAGTVKRVTLELGGKSPNIIFADADLERAVPASAAGIFNNSGQVCSAGSRIFVERPIYEAFLERFAAAADAYRVGPAMDPASQIGPLVSARQFERVNGYVAEAPAQGARLVAGGERLAGGAYDRGCFVPPTIFADVKDEMRIAREEVFGPVASVFAFDSLDEVVERANATEYGLASGVWTRDITRAHTVIRRLRAGSVWVNHYQAMDPAMPFGGYKMSGFGREGSFEHLDAYLQTKGVWIRTD